MLTNEFIEEVSYELIDLSNKIKDMETDDALDVMKRAVKRLSANIVRKNDEFVNFPNFSTYILSEIMEKEKLLALTDEAIKKAKENADVRDELVDVFATNYLSIELTKFVQGLIDKSDIHSQLKALLVHEFQKARWIPFCKSIVLEKLK